MTKNASNAENAEIARQEYIGRKTSSGGRERWHLELTNALLTVTAALEASGNLRDISGALAASSRHLAAFRQMLAPPCSQDQFTLISHARSKISESPNARGLTAERAEVARAAILEWLDRELVVWIDEAGNWSEPAQSSLDIVISRVQTLMAAQKVQTTQRGDASAEQERAVIDLLEGRGWMRSKSRKIEHPHEIPGRTFLHRAKFSIEVDEPDTAEVDVACSLAAGRVLAIECKVTNDETNSLKRVNDVLKKASAWKTHYGKQLETGAVLQGVIKPAHVNQLSAAGVHVFWSHNIEELGDWLEKRAAPQSPNE